jgi:S-adenosylmethionine synthetase
MNARRFETAESVTEGHPDKIADSLSDTVLDAYLQQDPLSRVACECLINSRMVVISGEITSTAKVDLRQIVMNVFRELGCDDLLRRIEHNEFAVITHLNLQSPDIAVGVDTGGAGDQGIMVGFACNETPELMPMPIAIANAITRRLGLLRHERTLGFLKPDGKSQVTVEYQDGKPFRVDTVVLSTQHSKDVLDPTGYTLSKGAVDNLIDTAILPAIPHQLADRNTRFLINPAGRFVIGGPEADSGLTGRKIICDSYGPNVAHGGGAFSGKDGTKVDRSGAYAARYIAKNIVAAQIADKCTVHLAYSIGRAEPISVNIDVHGAKVDVCNLENTVRQLFPLRPRAIIKHFNLHRGLLRKTSTYGHFGRSVENWDIFQWERTDKTDELRKAFGLPTRK